MWMENPWGLDGVTWCCTWAGAWTVQSSSSSVTALDMPEAVVAVAKGHVSNLRLKLQDMCVNNHKQKSGTV